MLPPSGAQFLLRAGTSRAALTEVGATLRLLEFGGESVLLSFEDGELCRDGRGQLLAPWPNRLEDGRYRFGETEGVAAWNEPERRNAIHGLLRWWPFAPVSVTESSVVLAAVLIPQPAYPWRLRVEATYALREAGLSVAVAATNESGSAAPFGLGFHPYFLAAGHADDAALLLAARTHLLADERGLPRGAEPLADFTAAAPLTSGNRLGEAVLDDCFTDLEIDGDGGFAVTFWPQAGGDRRIVVRAQGAFSYVMIYSADQLKGRERRRAVAIEPMTCPPNALRSGEGIITIEPGATFRAGISISLES